MMTITIMVATAAADHPMDITDPKVAVADIIEAARTRATIIMEMSADALISTMGLIETDITSDPIKDMMNTMGTMTMISDATASSPAHVSAGLILQFMDFGSVERRSSRNSGFQRRNISARMFIAFDLAPSMTKKFPHPPYRQA
jgi:hypothetical protein